MGNVIGIRKTADEPRIMIAAHMDQIGLMINHIDEKGYLYFSARGFDHRVLYGLQVVVHGEKGKLYGVIGAKPAHLVGREEREKTVKVKDMAIDIGASSREEALELGVNLGCIATPILEMRKLAKGDKVLGVGLDDKAGVAVMIRALELLNNEKLSSTIYAVATTQEEIGLRGATTASYRINPNIGIAIDVTHATTYNIEEKEVSGIQIGKGPAIGIGPNFHPKLWRIMEEICKEKNIPYQRNPIQGASGTDAWVIQVSREGVATALISIPLRYMHSPGEIVSLNDLENTAKLLAETIKKVSNENWQDIVKRI